MGYIDKVTRLHIRLQQSYLARHGGQKQKKSQNRNNRSLTQVYNMAPLLHAHVVLRMRFTP